MDRASIDRGWGAKMIKPGYDCGMTPPNGWDMPVVIGLKLEIELCTKHGKPFKNGHQMYRFSTRNRREIPLNEVWPVEIAIHKETFDRYNAIPQHWPELLTGEKVMCRCRDRRPCDFFECGHDAPLSCGRVSRDPIGDKWRKAINTDEWRCPACDYNKLSCLGSATGDL